MTPSDALYPIREICRITGVNPITLRAWERRYGLIEPIRTESGHRLYTQTHIDEVKSAVKLTEQGIPISQVKQLLESQAQQEEIATRYSADDLLAQLKLVVSDYDLSKLSQHLDLVFADSDENTLNFQLRRLMIDQKDLPRKYLALLEAQLLPRLYTRLRFATRHLNLSSCRKIWLQPENNKEINQPLVLLVALHFAQQGYYPMVNLPTETDSTALFTSIQQLHCEALAVVSCNAPLKETYWDVWTDQYKSLEFFYFTQQEPVAVLDKKIQCHHFNLNKPF